MLRCEQGCGGFRRLFISIEGTRSVCAVEKGISSDLLVLSRNIVESIEIAKALFRPRN